jgi:replication initiation and membrane attachment protein DnaB
MERLKELTYFYNAIREDHRIGTTHISLYMSLFQFYNLNGFNNPVEITRAAVMKVAKIQGIATFHLCIKDLNDFGYIAYKPSYNPAIRSKVYLLKV